MRTGKSFHNHAVFLGCWLVALGHCSGQGTLTRITFDGPPVVAPGTGVNVQQYFESGMWFRPIGPVDPGNTFSRRGGGSPAFIPDNGTAYIAAALGDSLMFGFLNGSVFGLYSVDLAEYSTVVPYAVRVHFVGYRQDGSAVTADLTTDGIIDGTGPVADFQTFYFGAEFTGLTRVEIPYPGWSLDNLYVFIPEPGAGALLTAGTALLGLRFLNRKR